MTNYQGKWQLRDEKHGKFLIAGDVYDGHVYHQDRDKEPGKQHNAWWVLEVVSPDQGICYVRDVKHGKCLVAGDVYDGHVYHQDPDGRANALWQRVQAPDGTYYLRDMKHRKCLVAGNVYDERVYHQDPNDRSNAMWLFDNSGFEETTLVDDIAGVLGRQGAALKGVTYLDTSGNKFTLLATPGVWDGSASVKQPTAECQRLLDEIKKTVASARRLLDITLLLQTGKGLPSGRFQAALADGFKQLTASGQKPMVRIMIGLPQPVPLDPVIGAALQDWLKRTIELDGRQSIRDLEYSIAVSVCRQSFASWNHAKIVAADARAVVGGHNLWEGDYLGDAPVHDVSGLIEGPAVTYAHNFCAELWKQPGIPPVCLIKGKFSSANPPPLSPGSAAIAGSTRMLALGRLGYGLTSDFTMASNASVSARIMALCRAKQTIKISQQSLYCKIMGQGGFDFYTMWAIVKALQAGVQVQIVVSNDASLSDGGYTGNLQKVLSALTTAYVADRLKVASRPVFADRSDINAWATAAATLPIDPELTPITVPRQPSEAECKPWLKDINERLSIAPLYYASGLNYWQVGSKKAPAANHAKVYIIDDTHFYVGSDNFYRSGEPHGLQEYGHLIQGQAETRKFVSDYWDRLWKNSGPHAVAATYGNVELVHVAYRSYPTESP